MMHRKPQEKHAGKIGGSIKDIIYGANDGIITTFAVVAGVTGAALEPKTIIILGLSNLVADGFSMAASNYLGSRSERQLIESERERELREIDQVPDEEMEEVRGILGRSGFGEEDQRSMTRLIGKNKSFFADFMLRYELGLNPHRNGDLWGAFLTFTAFAAAGLLPLLPFIFIGGTNSFSVSSLATGISLFGVGASRKMVTEKNWFVSGAEMLLIGGVAAAAAYAIGYWISRII